MTGLKRCRQAAFYFLIFFVARLLWFPAYFLLRGVLYPALCAWFPGVFRLYSFLLEEEAFRAMTLAIEAGAEVLALLLTALILPRLDNDRYEFVIAKTDGLYRLGDGFRLYEKRFFAGDLLGAVLSPIPFFATRPFVPEKVMERGLHLLYRGADSLAAVFGYAGGAAVTSALLLLFSTLGGLLAVRRFRAAWLSSFTQG